MFVLALPLLLSVSAPPPATTSTSTSPAPSTTTTTTTTTPPLKTPAQACRIAVLDLTARGLSAADKDYPQLLAEVMANEVASASTCQVISSSDIRSMIDFDTARSQCAEGAESCLADLGQALGVERLVAGSIGKLGTDYVITVRLVDIERAVVEQRAEEVVSGQPERLRLAAKSVARALFPSAAPVVAAAPPPPEPTESVLSPLLLGGVGVGALGVGGGLYGGYLAYDADQRLGDPKDTDKHGAFTQAQLGVGILAGAVVVTAAGVVATSVAAASPDL